VGEPKHSDFRIEQVELNELKQGEILLKTIYLSLDPYMRGRMMPTISRKNPLAFFEFWVFRGHHLTDCSTDHHFAKCSTG
jgi:NADPH-dependent curcumin reductase CurA